MYKVKKSAIGANIGLNITGTRYVVDENSVDVLIKNNRFDLLENDTPLSKSNINSRNDVERDGDREKSNVRAKAAKRSKAGGDSDTSK